MSPIIARHSPLLNPRAARPHAKPSTSSATRAQSQVCQIPNSFFRRAVFLALRAAWCNSSFGNVSSAASFEKWMLFRIAQKEQLPCHTIGRQGSRLFSKRPPSAAGGKRRVAACFGKKKESAAVGSASGAAACYTLIFYILLYALYALRMSQAAAVW